MEFTIQGITNDLLRKIGEHRDKTISGFTKKYNIEKLLYYEEHQDIREAIKREKLTFLVIKNIRTFI